MLLLDLGIYIEDIIIFAKLCGMTDEEVEKYESKRTKLLRKWKTKLYKRIGRCPSKWTSQDRKDSDLLVYYLYKNDASIARVNAWIHLANYYGFTSRPTKKT